MEKYQKYSIHILWSEEDQEYIATVPELKGCSAGGTTYNQALDEIQKAMELWLDHARELGDEIPKPSSSLLDETVQIQS